MFQPREDIISETLLWREGIIIADKPCRSPTDPLELIGVPIGAGDQTDEAYSRIGRTYVLYAFALASRGLDLVFHRIEAIVEFAFSVMLSV